ncbi:zinc-binding dehydrogenase [Amycolatopsis anabasis]|uniref:zinc-binding dehydrogenase n=1 Tax=Amycolatopsis anabasis TaxID=1840409 RepID=UPI00131A7B23|nr:zinc-binding dehydrogenase [Amycolatopsis anabasis]
MISLTHSGSPGLAGVRLAETAVPEPGPGEVLIRLRAAGLNHRDLFVAGGRSAGDAPVVLGADGAGVVAATGDGVALATGDEVIIDPTLGWADPAEVPEVPDILGGPSDGTFAEYVVVPARNAVPKPAHLDWSEAAALPLSAVTAYRALFTRGGLRAGEHVLLPGIGSGVATIALAMAKASGATVSVTSRSADKLRRARELGADHAVLSDADWRAELARPVDLVVDSIGTATFTACLSVLRPGGRLVSLGATTGPDVSLSLRELFFRQISLLGTSMGSASEFHDMLALVAEHRLRPIVHQTFRLADGPKALAELARGDQFGKLVLVIE